MKFRDENGAEYTEVARFDAYSPRDIEKPKPGYEYVTISRKVTGVRAYQWEIEHPYTGERMRCDTFEECMEKWFEGFNIPRLILDGLPEPFEVDIERVKKLFLDKKKEIEQRKAKENK